MNRLRQPISPGYDTSESTRREWMQHDEVTIMKYTGPIIRPPFFWDSPLLQVTVGCSYNKCTYCKLYREVSFEKETLEQIESDIREIREDWPRVDKLFLVNGDAFVLKADYLKEICRMILHHLPECQLIGAFASVRQIAEKSDQDLQDLSDLRLRGLSLGLETGLPDLLETTNKGHTIEDAIEQYARLRKVKIVTWSTFIIGLAGKGRGVESGLAAADLVNKTKSDMAWMSTLDVSPGTELHADFVAGKFAEASILENLEEVHAFLENIEMEGIPFIANHPSNAIPIAGMLPQDKDRMLEILKRGIEHFKTAA